MKLHQIIAARLLELPSVRDLVGKNETDFTDADDQYCVRIGGLLEHDPYPGIIIFVPDQQITSDLSDQVRLITSRVVLRCVGYDLAACYALANACAFDGQLPQESPSGLDGWRDMSKGIQSTGLRDLSEQATSGEDGTDRLLWLVEYEFSVDWFWK